MPEGVVGESYSAANAFRGYVRALGVEECLTHACFLLFFFLRLFFRPFFDILLCGGMGVSLRSSGSARGR